MKNSLRFLSLLVLLCAAAHSQDATSASPTVATPTSTEPNANAIANFFESLKSKQVDKAYDELVKGTKIAEKPKDVSTLKAKTTEAIALFGQIQGYEIVETKMVGTHLARFTCLSIGKDFPLRWRFYFYLAEPLWRLIDIRVDDRLADMFDEGERAEAPEQKK